MSTMPVESTQIKFDYAQAERGDRQIWTDRWRGEYILTDSMPQGKASGQPCTGLYKSKWFCVAKSSYSSSSVTQKMM